MSSYHKRMQNILKYSITFFYPRPHRIAQRIHPGTAHTSRGALMNSLWSHLYRYSYIHAHTSPARARTWVLTQRARTSCCSPRASYYLVMVYTLFDWQSCTVGADAVQNDHVHTVYTKYSVQWHSLAWPTIISSQRTSTQSPFCIPYIYAYTPITRPVPYTQKLPNCGDDKNARDSLNMRNGPLGCFGCAIIVMRCTKCARAAWYSPPHCSKSEARELIRDRTHRTLGCARCGVWGLHQRLVPWSSAASTSVPTRSNGSRTTSTNARVVRARALGKTDHTSTRTQGGGHSGFS